MRKNKSINRNKIQNKYRIPFILYATIPALISFLVFYVYVNASSFGMAFTGSEGGFSLEHFQGIIREFQMKSSTIRIAIKNTFLTFGVTLLLYPIQVLVAYFLYKKIPFAGLYRIVFFLPTIIFSVCVSLVFTRMIGPSGWIAQTIGARLGLEDAPELLADSRFANTVVLLHMIWLSLPSQLILWGGTFARIPDEVLEAGRIDGTTWISEFTRIIVPLVWPTLSLQMVMLFANIFNSSGAVHLLTAGEYGTMTLSAWMYIYLQQHSGASYGSNVYNYLSAMGVVITVIAITLTTVVRKVADKYFNDVEF